MALSIPSVTGFDRVGYGICIDASGNSYDYYLKDSGSFTDCGSACKGIDIDGLVGFTFGYLASGPKCYCYFGDNIVSPDGITSRSGTGEVASASGSTSLYCYKVENFSEKPSLTPSLMPSVTPSDRPTEIPSTSLKPSLRPSTPPSGSLQPSYIPSLSIEPSNEPNTSSKPSHRPSNSVQPSSTSLAQLRPTQAPGFMDNTVAKPMWYPDWTGANEGCINDGNEESYMRLNPAGYYLFDTLESCCSKHYSWNYNQCAGIDGNAIGPNGGALYYPDWDGENRSCKNDGHQPAYMSTNPEAWMFADLASCCKKRYQWNLDECMGSSADAASAGSGNWYPDWERSICVQDCVGASPCGGLAHDWDPQYPSVAACCDSKFSWVTDCNTKSTSVRRLTRN